MQIRYTVVGDDGQQAGAIADKFPPGSGDGTVELVQVWRDQKLRSVRMTVILDEPEDGKG